MARPTRYDSESCTRIAKTVCELGGTDAEVATALGIRLSTLNLWKGKHPEFMDSLRVGKAPADDRVERSLFLRATGYTHPEVDIRTVTLPNNGGSEIVQTPIIKHYPPDTTAMIFWLKNRRPDKFRAAPEDHTPREMQRITYEVVR